MSFLNPVLLFALPAIALPLIIHLINRRRFRKKAWGPMMFLREAMREKRGHRRLREWLVLACRMLAIAILVLAVSRPLIGGWLSGWIGSGDQPVMILVDRSASMEMRLPGQVQTKRELALSALITETERVAPSPLTLLDTATQELRELKSADALSQLAATDSQCDWPGSILSALRAWQTARYGRGELWLASDMQTSNWSPDDARWAEVRALYQQLPNAPTIRLLTMRGHQPNLTLTLASGDIKNELLVTIAGSTPDLSTEVPLTWVVEGNQHVQNIALADTLTSISLTIPGSSTEPILKGSVRLPDDGNNRDNQAYFAIDQASDLTNFVVSEDPAIARLLQLACSPWKTEAQSPKTEWRRPGELQGMDWSKVPLVIWQAGEVLPALDSFIDRGGQLLLFPDASVESIAFDSHQQVAPADAPLQVTSWTRNHGPLANTSSGTALPLERLRVRQWADLRQPDGTVLASLSNGEALVRSIRIGDGLVHTCGTLPIPTWSNLGEGLVLVPMVQRLIRTGILSLAATHQVACDATEPLAGLYEENGKITVRYRPSTEDLDDNLADDVVQALFAGMSVNTFDLAVDSGSRPGALVSEWWRPFLVCMLLLLAAESLLTLPSKPLVPTPS